MIGIWGSDTGTGDDGMLGATGRDQATSLVALYGPRTTVLVALDDGVFEFSYGCTPEGCQLPDGEFTDWICSRSNIEISPDCKIFSPANMRAAQEVEGYKKLLSKCPLVPGSSVDIHWYLLISVGYPPIS